MIGHLDGAIVTTMPSPKRPLALGHEWISVGLDNAFVWRLPLLNEPPWDGHHYVVELTRDPITREVRRKVAATVERMQAYLPTLSRIDRNEILRRAVYGAGGRALGAHHAVHIVPECGHNDRCVYTTDSVLPGHLSEPGVDLPARTPFIEDHRGCAARNLTASAARTARIEVASTFLPRSAGGSPA